MSVLAAGAAMGQATPTHALPFDKSVLEADDATFVEWFPAWEVGTPPSGVSKLDDEFFISRTRPLPRISEENDTYDANPAAPYGRKFCGFYGADDPTIVWKTLPRYCFEGDNYSMWSYTDMFSNWTAPFFRVTAGLSDVAARNGSSVGCCWTIPFEASFTWNTTYRSNNYAKKMGMLCDKDNDGNFLYAEKLVKLMKYYGINALGFNSEFITNEASMTKLQDFFAECHKIAERLDWKFEVHWYAGTSDYGNRRFDNGLSGFEKTFGTADHKVTDMLFLNYNWTQSQLDGMDAAAAALNRSSYDVFAGFDIQGRGVRRTPYNNSWGWDYIKANKVSIGFWGAHRQNLIHESSTDYGTSDIALQRAYLKKQELIMSGGYNNPACRPPINENVAGLGIDALGKFHGLADMMTAKSSIQQLPFVTRFNLGNGQKFYNRGEVAFDSKWYNLGTQDFLPTWRWWITDKSDAVKESNLSSLVKAELTFDEAWFGGSCLSLSGATAFSRVKLFKTLLEANSNEELSIVYKPVGSADSHLKLFVSLKGAVTDYKEIAVPAGKAGQWNTFTAKLSELGVSSGQIALIGLVVENTTADYKTLVGELALRDPSKSFSPVKAAVKEVEIMKGRYNQVDFKMRYAAKEESGETKTYNDEVDTWYYEIFIQQENQEPVLLTATPSWAAYVIGAPLKSGYEGRRARFGVRAVSPNGDIYNNNTSDISWSEYMDVPYNETLTDLKVSKAVIKPNEEFTVGYVDDMAPAAQKWEILNTTGDVVAQTTNALTLTTKLAEIGIYDLRLTDPDGKVVMMRAKIQVTPEATGAVPAITSITSDKATAETTEEVTYTYSARNGEGKVSRALKIADPLMLQIPGEIQEGNEYSYALWFKADDFAHLSNGTNLISKNTVADKWPHNNWGDLWVQIRGAGQEYVYSYTGGGNGSYTEGGEISFNVMGWEAHQDPWVNMTSIGYSVAPGSWYHLVVTQNTDKRQCMYINGELIKSTTATFAKRRPDYAYSDARVNQDYIANIHIGGSGVYKAAFNGSVDEVQVWNKALTAEEVKQAMKGYAEGAVPANLQGYYTFETMNADGTFPNLGHAGDNYTAKVVATEGSGGEDTSGAMYVQKDADNSMLGYPGIEGSLEVKTTAEWTLNGANEGKTSDNAVTVTYNAPGKYDAVLTLTNGWGSDTMTEVEIVEITGTVGIDDTFAEGELEVASYNGAVALRFAEAGAYTVNIVALDGKTLQSENINAEAGSTATVAVNAQRGVYLVQVLLNGHQVKVVKIVK